MIAGPSEAKLCMARDPFNDEMLRIHLSDLNQTFRKHRRAIEATFYTGGVSVIITNDEDLLEDSFIT